MEEQGQKIKNRARSPKAVEKTERRNRREEEERKREKRKMD